MCLNLGCASRLQDIAEVACNCFTQPPWNEKWTPEQLVDYFQRYVDVHASFHMVSDGEGIEAFGIGLPLDNYWDKQAVPTGRPTMDVFYIAALATDPTYRRRGACTSIVQAFVSYARSQGFRFVAVRTREDNYSAIGIFEKLGFVKSSDVEAETGGVRSPRVVYVIDLAI